MKHFKDYNEFFSILKDRTKVHIKSRAEFLTGAKPQKEQYAIKITIELDPIEDEEDIQLLLEHDEYKQFQKTTNRYVYHAPNANIPVMGHYHVYPARGKKELYAVNVIDGTAHHKVHRGHTIPRKEADELRSMGVNIPDNNILEAVEYDYEEELTDDYYTFHIVIDED